MRPSKVSPERAALASVIDEIAGLERDLAASRDAAETAAEKRREATALAERLRAERDGAQSDAQSLVAAITAGDGVQTLLASEAASVEREQLAVRDAEVWRNAETTCRERAKALEEALSLKHWRVVAGAKAVIRASVDVGPILDGLAELQQEVIDRRCALHCLAREDLLGEQDKQRVIALLRENWTLPNIPQNAQWHSNRVYKEWLAALRALERDASAPLPSEAKQ